MNVDPDRPDDAPAEPAADTPAPPPFPTHVLHGFSVEIVEELVAKRGAVIQAARDYDDAKAAAASAKKAWDQKREIFEAAFDRAVTGGTEAGLPFDGVHQSDVDQPGAGEPGDA